MQNKLGRVVGTSLLLLFLVASGVVLWQRQAVLDWWKLRGYQPSAAISSIATQDTMTSQAKHLFYVNRPAIANSVAFSQNCPAAREKTIVLGCYKSGDNGIFVYNVSDPRLQGVEQVTAAHEMLHAAYDRLSSKDRKYVDGLLQDYYQNDLHDQRILDTIDAYKQSEPNDIVNEMHSVFGTEIADLPAPLEQYYRRYFANRSVVVNLAIAYENEFTSRQAAIAAYDAQLVSLKAQIDSSEAELQTQKAQLETMSAQLDAYRSSGDVSAYNSGVAQYNSAVARYNKLVAQTKNLISQYNVIVDKRNAVVLEEQQLTQAISSTPQPVQ